MGRAICTTDSARRRPLALEPIASASTNYRAEYARIADSHALERRRGTLTAMAIEDAIQRKGWPIGAVFGPEPALAESFGVGVRVARQAFRLLEARGACRLQRGRGGGLIIRKPEIGSTALVMAHHLIWSGATMDEVWDARMILEPMAFAAAATSGEGLCDTDLDQMDASAALANQIANPCLALAFMCLEQFPGASACASWAVRADLKAAIAQGAADRAAQLAAEAVALRRSRDDGCLGDQFGLAVSAHAQLQSRRNLASALALRIGADISYQGCREGRRLGSLAELGERYNIGLPVLIEAIRILEDIGVVECLKGRVGGIELRLPRWNSVVEIVNSYLPAARASPFDCSEAPAALNVLAANRAALKHSTAIDGAARRSLTRIACFNEPDVVLNWYDLQRVFYDVSGNLVLHAITKCISAYSVRAFAADQPTRSSQASLQIQRGARTAIQGLLAGDATRAAQGQAEAHAILFPLLQPKDRRLAAL